MSENRNVCWEELLPAELEARLAAFPVVYLPLGLCEPHGHIAPFGLLRSRRATSARRLVAASAALSRL